MRKVMFLIFLKKNKMAGRYIITGVQLGMLYSIDDKEKREKLINEIIDNQFIGNSENHILKDVEDGIGKR